MARMLDTLAIFGVLVVVTAISVAVFVLETRRWTTRRWWVALTDWAAANGFAVRREGTPEVSAVLASIGLGAGRPGLNLSRAAIWIFQMETGGQDGQATRWNLVMQKVGRRWPATGLRPAGPDGSIVDVLALTSYPSLANAERFVVHGAETAAARALAGSPMANLLPRDIGLLLAGEYLVLDFTRRPFDTIEFGRMLALAKQLAEGV